MKVTFSCLTLCNTMDCSLPGSSSMEFSRQEYWSRLPFPLQGIFLTQGSNPGLPHCRRILYHLSHQGSPVTYKGTPQKTMSWLFVRNFTSQKGLAGYIQSAERKTKTKTYYQEYSTWQSYHSELSEWKSFQDKQKLKEFITTKPALQEMIKGLL